MSRPPRASPAHGTLLSHASTEWSLFPPRVHGHTCAGRPSLSPRPASPWRPLPRHPIAVSSSRPNPTPVLSPPFHLRVCARRNASRFSVPLKLLELAEVPRGLEFGCSPRRRTVTSDVEHEMGQKTRNASSGAGRVALLHLLAQRARWRHRWTCSTRPL